MSIKLCLTKLINNSSCKFVYTGDYALISCSSVALSSLELVFAIRSITKLLSPKQTDKQPTKQALSSPASPLRASSAHYSLCGKFRVLSSLKDYAQISNNVMKVLDFLQ